MIPFGILRLGKQPGFILEVGWSVCVYVHPCLNVCVCVCLEEGCFVGDEGLSELGIGERERRERIERG